MALTGGLVSYYKFDDASGNASESTASANTLTNNGTVAYAAGKLNNAADFGTTNSTKSLTRNGYLVSDGAVSFSLWGKQQTEIGSGIQTFLQIGTQSTGFRLDYDYNAGSRRLSLVRLRNSLATVTTSYTITLGTSSYYHLVGVYDLSTITLYVNGASVSTTAASLNGTTNWSPDLGHFSVGAIQDLNSGGFSQYASIFADELGIWNKGLTSTEVTTLYNTGVVNPYPFNTAYSMMGGVGSFTLSGQSNNLFPFNITNTSKPTTAFTNLAKP